MIKSLSSALSALGLLSLLAASSLQAQTTGNLTLERWENMPASYSVLALQREGISLRAPDSTTLLPGAEWTANQGDYYGIRLRGTLTAPLTGTYTFFVAGDDNTELYLSEDGIRFNKERIAWAHNWTSPQQWDKYPTQRSKAIALTTGQNIYIEAQMMEWSGGDHLSIGWAYEAPVALQQSDIGTPVTATWSESGGTHSLSVQAGDIWGTGAAFPSNTARGPATANSPSGSVP